MAKAVISVIGQDRPGIVNALSERILELGLNIEDSRMTVLGGEFAVLMAVAGATQPLQQLQDYLDHLAAEGEFACLYRPTTDRLPADYRSCHVEVASMDHPGIVHRVAGFFSARNINIRELSTETSPAAHTGTPVFELSLWIEVSPDIDLSGLQADFAHFCEAEALDGTLTPDID
jgi:glycine cleavage system transcriptional repressor